jgi:hypothetical protein
MDIGRDYIELPPRSFTPQVSRFPPRNWRATAEVRICRTILETCAVARGMLVARRGAFFPGNTMKEAHVKKYALYAALVAAGAASAAAGSSVMAQQDAGSAHAQARLEGFQEVPAVSTTGRGAFSARIDDTAQTITWQLSYADLEGHLVAGGVVTAAHIHVGQRGVNGGVSAFFCGGGGKPPCPTEGELSGVITPVDVLGPASQGVEAGSFDELVRAIRAGKTYVNVHTTRWPGGEVRGQVNAGDDDR